MSLYVVMFFVVLQPEHEILSNENISLLLNQFQFVQILVLYVYNTVFSFVVNEQISKLNVNNNIPNDAENIVTLSSLHHVFHMITFVFRSVLRVICFVFNRQFIRCLKLPVLFSIITLIIITEVMKCYGVPVRLFVVCVCVCV